MINRKLDVLNQTGVYVITGENEVHNGYRLLAIGYRLLVIGYWLSDIGYWIWVIGYWWGRVAPVSAQGHGPHSGTWYCPTRVCIRDCRNSRYSSGRHLPPSPV